MNTERTASQILATMELSAPALTMVPRPKPSSYGSRMRQSSPEWRRKWLDNHLGLENYHSDVPKLESYIWTVACGYAETPLRGRRLVIYGTNGNGKSRCLRRLKRWADARAVDFPLVQHDDQASTTRCVLVNWAEQVDEFKRPEVNWDIERLLDADLLLIDDIGSEHDPSKAGLEKLYLILERREFKWTVITTNKEPEAWERAFERRIADRLFRNCDHCDLSKLPSYSTR